MSGESDRSSEPAGRNICRRTHDRCSAEEKIGSVLHGLRGEASLAELCHRESRLGAKRIRALAASWMLPQSGILDWIELGYPEIYSSRHSRSGAVPAVVGLMEDILI
jgi:hypothetical protein